MPRTKQSITINDFYKDYKATTVNPVDSRLFRAICEDFNIMIQEELKNGSEFVIPYNLGKLRIKKKKTSPKQLKVDFGLLKKEGIKSYHFNDHTDGYYAKYYWEKRYYNSFAHKKYYSFKPTRANKRDLAQRLLTDINIDFFG